MGGNTLMHKFFKTDYGTYQAVQTGLDEALYDEYILTEKCAHILSPDLQPMSDGLIYIVMPEFITSNPAAEIYINQLLEISSEEFYAAVNS